MDLLSKLPEGSTRIQVFLRDQPTVRTYIDVLVNSGADRSALQSPEIAVDEPVIVSLGPDNGPAGTEITIDGYNLDTLTELTINGTTVPPEYIDVIDAETVVLTIPPGASSGPVVITTPDGTAESPEDLEVPLEVVSLSDPGGSPGDTVTITVSGYDPSEVDTVVSFPDGSGGTVPATIVGDPTIFYNYGDCPCGCRNRQFNLDPRRFGPTHFN